MNIFDAIADPQVFKPWFRDPATWTAWRAFLATLFALPMDAEALAIYRQCTARETPPTEPAQEAWLVVGRRGGKSFVVALVAVFLACFRDWTDCLARGERGTIMVVASDRQQARVILRYVRALLTEIPMLARLIERQLTEAVDLSNGISIEVHTASFRTVRGYTVVAALLDEIAFFRSDESATPDRELLTALRPAMATVADPLLIGLSSPYARRGALWEVHRDHFGKEDDPVLVWQAETRTMNPSVPQDVIDQAYELDAASAAAEYGAQFRSDLEALFDIDLLDGLTRASPPELPPIEGMAYFAFADPSGGRGDAFTLAIAHRDGSRIIVDLCRSRRSPFDPGEVVNEFAAVLRDYHLSGVTGDRYGAEWVSEAFRKAGITYRPSRLPKSDLYIEALPVFTQGNVELPPDRRLVSELAALERRTARSGKDSVDHPPRGHDDLANAVAGAVWLARKQAEICYPKDLMSGLERPSLNRIYGEQPRWNRWN